MIPLLPLLLSLSLADHRLSKQRQAWVRIVNLIEPEGLFTDIPLRSVVLHNPGHQDKIEHDFVYNIATIPYYSISSEWLTVNATSAEGLQSELSPTGTAYIPTLSDDPYTPLNSHWYPFLDVLFVEVEEQALLTLDRKRVDRDLTGSVCNLGVAPASSSSSTLSLCLHNNQLLMLNTTRIVLHLTQADCQGECSPNVTASVSTVGNRMRFTVGSGRHYVSVKYLGITGGYTTQTELCGFYMEFIGSGQYSSVLRVNSTVSTMYECVTFQLQQPKHHFPTGVMVAVGVVTAVVVLCLYGLYRCCPAARFRQMFSSQPARKRLSLQDIHVMHGTSSGAVTKEPQYEQPAELQNRQYYEMPTADPYADIGTVPESVYESVYESIDDQSSNAYSLPSHQMSHISLDSRPNPGRQYNPSISGSQYNGSSNKDSVKGSRYNK